MEKTLQIVSNNAGTNTEFLNIKLSQGVGDFLLQVDVGSEEPPSLQSFNGVNINSHIDITQAILRQVNATQESIFLNILQHLLSIDTKANISNIIWNTAEKLVHRATLVKSQDDSEGLLRSTIAHNLTCPRCSCSDESSVSSTPPISLCLPDAKAEAKEQSTSTVTSKPAEQQIPNVSVSPPALPPPVMPPPPPMPGAPPPPPVPGMPPPPPIPGMPPPPPIPGMPPPPPVPGGPPLPPGSLNSRPIKNVLLPHQNTPSPKPKMKSLSWNKILPQKIIGKRNCWTLMKERTKENIDFDEMEQLFCLKTVKPDQPKSGDAVDGKSKKESSTVHLIDGKRSLNINIFLRQFKGYDSNEAIVELIRSGNHKVIGPERLQGLLNLLPGSEEITTLNEYPEKEKLGSAEKFILLLTKIPDYKLSIESMLLKEEFAANITYLEPSITAMIEAGNELMNNQIIPDILYIVMILGNFLNSGGYAGNAAGVSLSSLTAFFDVRANKPGMNLMHFMAIQIEKFSPALKNFPKELSFLENVSKINLEQIASDIKNLDMQLEKISRQLQQNQDIDAKIHEQMREFLQVSVHKINQLKEAMNHLDDIRLKLADFFCEDASKFRLDECFKIFHTFCEKFTQSLKENEKRQQVELQTLMRQKQKEEQAAKKKKNENTDTSPNKRSRVQNNNSSGYANRRIDIQIYSGHVGNTNQLEGDELMNYLQTSAPGESPRGRKSRISISYQNRPDKLSTQGSRERSVSASTSREIIAAPAVEIEELPSISGTGAIVDQPTAVDIPRRDKIDLSKSRRNSYNRSTSMHFDSGLPALPEGKYLTSEPSKVLPRQKRTNTFHRSMSYTENLSNNNQHISSTVEVVETSTNIEANDDNSVPTQSIAIEHPIHCNTGNNTIKTVSNLKTKPRFERSRSQLEIDLHNPEYFKRNPVERNDKTVKSQQFDLNATDTSKKPRISLRTVAKIIKFGRSYSSINANDLQEAIIGLRTPTIVPDYIWHEHNQRAISMQESAFNFDVSPVSINDKHEASYENVITNEPAQNGICEINDAKELAACSTKVMDEEEPSSLSDCAWRLPDQSLRLERPKRTLPEIEPHNKVLANPLTTELVAMDLKPETLNDKSKQYKNRNEEGLLERDTFNFDQAEAKVTQQTTDDSLNLLETTPLNAVQGLIETNRVGVSNQEYGGKSAVRSAIIGDQNSIGVRENQVAGDYSTVTGNATPTANILENLTDQLATIIADCDLGMDYLGSTVEKMEKPNDVFENIKEEPVNINSTSTPCPDVKVHSYENQHPADFQHPAQVDFKIPENGPTTEVEPLEVLNEQLSAIISGCDTELNTKGSKVSEAKNIVFLEDINSTSIKKDPLPYKLHEPNLGEVETNEKTCVTSADLPSRFNSPTRRVPEDIADPCVLTTAHLGNLTTKDPASNENDQSSEKTLESLTDQLVSLISDCDLEMKLQGANDIKDESNTNFKDQLKKDFESSDSTYKYENPQQHEPKESFAENIMTNINAIDTSLQLKGDNILNPNSRLESLSKGHTKNRGTKEHVGNNICEISPQSCTPVSYDNTTDNLSCSEQASEKTLENLTDQLASIIADCEWEINQQESKPTKEKSDYDQPQHSDNELKDKFSAVIQENLNDVLLNPHDNDSVINSQNNPESSTKIPTDMSVTQDKLIVIPNALGNQPPRDPDPPTYEEATGCFNTSENNQSTDNTLESLAEQLDTLIADCDREMNLPGSTLTKEETVLSNLQKGTLETNSTTNCKDSMHLKSSEDNLRKAIPSNMELSNMTTNNFKDMQDNSMKYQHNKPKSSTRERANLPESQVQHAEDNNISLNLNAELNDEVFEELSPLKLKETLTKLVPTEKLTNDDFLPPIHGSVAAANSQVIDKETSENRTKKSKPADELKTNKSLRQRLFNTKPKTGTTMKESDKTASTPKKIKSKSSEPKTSAIKMFSKRLAKSFGIGKSQAKKVETTLTDTAISHEGPKVNAIPKSAPLANIPKLNESKTAIVKKSSLTNNQVSTARPLKSSASQNSVASQPQTSMPRSSLSSTVSAKSTTSTKRNSVTSAASGKSAMERRSTLRSSVTSNGSSPRVSINSTTLHATYVRSQIGKRFSVTPSKKLSNASSTNRRPSLDPNGKATPPNVLLCKTQILNLSDSRNPRRSSLVERGGSVRRSSLHGKENGTTNKPLCKSQQPNVSGMNIIRRSSLGSGIARRPSLVFKDKENPNIRSCSSSTSQGASGAVKPKENQSLLNKKRPSLSGALRNNSCSSNHNPPELVTNSSTKINQPVLSNKRPSLSGPTKSSPSTPKVKQPVLSNKRPSLSGSTKSIPSSTKVNQSALNKKLPSLSGSTKSTSSSSKLDQSTATNKRPSLSGSTKSIPSSSNVKQSVVLSNKPASSPGLKSTNSVTSRVNSMPPRRTSLESTASTVVSSKSPKLTTTAKKSSTVQRRPSNSNKTAKTAD